MHLGFEFTTNTVAQFDVKVVDNGYLATFAHPATDDTPGRGEILVFSRLIELQHAIESFIYGAKDNSGVDSSDNSVVQ